MMSPCWLGLTTSLVVYPVAAPPRYPNDTHQSPRHCGDTYALALVAAAGNGGGGTDTS